LHAILSPAVGAAAPEELAPAERMDPDLKSV
jgi:hypothetical protein